MAAAPTTGTIAPGIATTDTYPQWSVGGGTPGSSAGWKIVEATTAAQKNTYAGEGYLVWFSSQGAAQSFLSTEESPIASGEPQGSLLGTLAEFLGVGKISGTNLVIRAAKVLIGGVLLIVGIVHITGVDNAVASVARKVPLPI